MSYRVLPRSYNRRRGQLNILLSWIKASRPAIAFTCVLASSTQAALAGGVSGYLPINLEPEMERQIERVLILADEPILKRPFAVALVEDALPQACMVDKPLCTKVKHYLQRYSRDYAVTHASAAGAITRDTDRGVVPNSYGMPVRSDRELSLAAFVQPNDYFLASAGAVSYAGRTVPTGTMLSAGFNWAQLDIGYRDHWFSPMTGSDMLISTEAPTTPSVTLSNYEPLTRLGLQYEFFLTRVSRTKIHYNGQEGVGNPRLFGVQISIEPFPGWSLGVNRLLQYGGGPLPGSARFLLRDFFKPSGLSQTQGNQEASYVSRFLIPGKTPFAVYFQYGGQDNSNGGSYLLGNVALSGGIDFPRLWHHFDLTYEVSEWQNLWYAKQYIFSQGMTNDGLVLGNWGADQRNFGDGVGARSQMLRIGWEPPFGGYLEERLRTVANQTYYGGGQRVYTATPLPFPYHHYYDLTVRYSRPWKDLTVGGEVLGGRDIYGKSFSRLSAFVRYGGDEHTRDDDSLDEESYSGGAEEHGTELFVDAGMNVNRVRTDLNKEIPITTSKWAFAPHLGLGARRAVSEKNDLGVRLELDQVQGRSLLGMRAVDYRYRFSDSFAAGVFLGAARYGQATPAYSLYFGAGALWRNVLPKWDVGIDFRHAQNVARDHMLASDPHSGRAETFYKIDTGLLYVSRRF